jgi:hypothetical protein
MTTTQNHRPTESICPPWCTGHAGSYQGWETRIDNGRQIREHSGGEIHVGAAHAYLNRTESEGHSLTPAQIDVYVDQDTAELTPAQAREFAQALLAAAERAESHA